jgi:hypothetical protein
MRTIFTAAAVGSLLCLGACASTDSAKGPQAKATSNAPAASAGMLANTKCPIVPDHPIDPSVTTMFKGIKVGFCCAGCIDEWDKVSEAKKSELLAKAK